MKNKKIDKIIEYINTILNDLDALYDICCNLEYRDDIILNKITLLKDRCINLVMYLENSKFKNK